MPTTTEPRKPNQKKNMFDQQATKINKHSISR